MLNEFFDAELEQIVQEHVHTESVAETSSTKAETVGFDRMVWLEGGSQNPSNI